MGFNIRSGSASAGFDPGDARPFRTGGNVYNASPVVSISSVVLVQNTLYAAPFLVPVPTTFVSIGVVSTGVALSSARLGIYADVAGVPATQVLDAGSVGTTTTAFQTIAINKALSAGWYWLACAVQGAAGNIFCTSLNSNPVPVGLLAPGSTGPINGYSQTGVAGALPAPWGATFTDTVAVPVVWMAAQ